MRSLSSTVIAALLTAAPVAAQAQERATEGIGSRLSVAATVKATVTIEATGPGGQAEGSGFLVDPEGVVATAAHLIGAATAATVRLSSGEVYEVEGVIAVDERRDYAILRIAGYELPTVSLGNSDDIEVGERVMVIGNPLGLEATVSDGLVSAVRLDEGTKLFQISAPVAPGSSGGPVITEDGSVVGIVVSGIRGGGAENLNFALPVNYLRGHLSLASAQAPTPLSQLSWKISPRTAQPGIDAVTGEELPPTVNDSLHLDWAALNGVEIFYEIKLDDGSRDHITVRYSITTNHRGERLFEAHTKRENGKLRGDYRNRRLESVFIDEIRTVVNLERPNNIDVYAARTSYDSSVPGTEYHLSIDGTQVAFDSAGTRRTGWVPAGTLPSTLLEASTAALRDSLTGTLHVWFLRGLTWPAEVRPVKFEFGRAQRKEVKIAKLGQRCGLRADTEKQLRDFVSVTLTVDARKRDWHVMSTHPHVGFTYGDEDNVKCLALPRG